jgi:hypothetical protein
VDTQTIVSFAALRLCAFARLTENALISRKALLHWHQVSDWQDHEIRR